MDRKPEPGLRGGLPPRLSSFARPLSIEPDMISSSVLPSASAPPAAAETDRPAAARRPLAAALIALVALVLLGLWSWVAYQTHREAQEALQQGRISLGNLGRGFAEHTVKTLEGADQAVRFIRREYLTQGAALDIPAYLRQGDLIQSDYHLLSVIGPDGYISHSSQPFQRVDLRDREHFRVHAEGHEDRLFISRPLLGRVSGKWSIQATRRVDRSDGSFGGVVVLSLTPDYLIEFYREVDLGRQGGISLTGYDGVVRARAFGRDRETGQDVSRGALFNEVLRRRNGTLVARSDIDGVERLWAFRALDDYRLMVLVSMSTDDLFAEVRQRRTIYLAGAAAISAMLLGFLVFLLRAAGRQQAMLERLSDSERRANAANEMKTKFLASVSHELRTPLNGILGYAELIRDTSSDPESREFGAIVHQSAQHLHSLVNTILDLAKIESGRMTLHIEAVDLRELLGRACDLNTVFAESRGLTLSLDIDPAAPPLLHTDRTRLVQVLNNLLSNAIKFTERGGVRLAVRPVPQGVLIRVEDSGIGMSAQQLATIFTRFHATTSDFVHPAQGAGLGLPLARELSELLGGTLELASAPGQGTVASLRLPLRAPASKETPT